MTTVGDKIKVMLIDSKGKAIPLLPTEKENLERDAFLPVNTVDHCYHDFGLVDTHEHQIFLQPAS